MKHTRKIFAILLVLILALSMAVPAFAATTGTITINREAGVSGKLEYNVYLMATLVSSSGDSYSYKIADGWENFFKDQKIPYDETSKLITYKTGITDLAAFAKAAVAYAKANSIAGTKLTIAADQNSAVLENIELGYYCIDSQVGTVCALTTANPDASITDKNPPPSIEKTVMEDSNSTYGTINDDSIGKAVNFRLEVTKRAGALKYIVTDTMSAGLTFNPASVKVYYNVETAASSQEVVLTEGTDYVLVNTPEEFALDAYKAYNNRTFLVAFNDDTLAKLTDGTHIRIDYTATINENAVIGTEGNPNEATIIYGNAPFESAKTTTITYVWDFGIYKYTVAAGANTALPNAQFVVLLKDTTTTTPVSEAFLKLAKDETASAKAGYPVYKVNAAPVVTVADATVITTDATGKFGIIGLDSGIYWLRETKAPDGYNQLSYDVEIDIIADGQYATGTSLSYHVKNADADGFINVENSTGVKLPETGSFGTFMFTLIGSIVVLSMGTLLVVKKRMTKVVYTK